MNIRKTLLFFGLLMTGGFTPGTVTSQSIETGTHPMSPGVASSSVLKVNICNSDAASPGLIALSTYSSDILFIDRFCRVRHVYALSGPMTFYTLRDEGGGYGIISDGIVQHDQCGRNQLPTEKIRRALKGWPHHDFRHTPWGTYITIAVKPHSNKVWEDMLIEFDSNGDILARMSLNKVFLGKQKARNVASGEHWIHTNSLDFLPSGELIVSLRNLNKVAIIDWKDKKVVREFGEAYLQQQHYPRYDRTEELILVFDNGVERKSSSLVKFSTKGEFLGRWDLGFYSRAYGSIQRLPNGNWLTVDGMNGKIVEFDSELQERIIDIDYRKHDYIPFLRDKDTGKMQRKPHIYRVQKLKRYPFSCRSST